jgi:YbbR domain-containing protein
VQVTMQGTGWDMLLGSNQSIALALNTDAVQIYPLKNLIIQNLGNELVSSNVEQIIIQLEDAVTGTFPIEAVTNITFAKGFDLAQDIELNPSVVTVVGPKTVLENLETIKTDTLKAVNLSEKKTQKINLIYNPILQFNISETEAHIQAEQFTEKSMFIPIVVKNAPDKLKIFPNKIKLDCTVALSRYAELNANNFVVEVDLRFSTGKGNTLPIILSKQSPFARNIKFSPKSAEFYIEK